MRSLDTMGILKKLFGKSSKMLTVYKEKTVKVLVMGKDGVGKTSIIKKLCNPDDIEEKYQPTLYEVYQKKVIVDEYNVTMQFMDMGGSHSFPSMQEVFIKQADIYILTYSADDQESFSKMIELREQIVAVKHKHTTELPIIVVRNKIDLRKKRTKKEQTRRKSVYQWCYLSHDVSAKTGVKINAIMDSLIEESKFIGNTKDLGDMKISGRYIYNEDHESTEIYHKLPNVFRSYEHENSDERMEKRRRRSLQHHARKSSRASRSSSFSSFTSFRRRMSRKESSLTFHQISEEANSSKVSSRKSSLGSKDSLSKVSNGSASDKGSKANSPTSSLKDITVSNEVASARFKRKIFRTSGRRSCLEENSSNEPNFIRQNLSRQKSVSASDLTSLKQSQSNNKKLLLRDRSSSVNDSKNSKKTILTRQRSVSVGSKDIPKKQKPQKLDIKHASFDNGSHLKIRRLSSSLATLNESKASISTEADETKMKMERRKSLSQNDLALSIMRFNASYNFESSMGKKRILYNEKKTCLKLPEVQIDGTETGKLNELKKRSVSFGKSEKKLSVPKKLSVQSNISVRSNVSAVSNISDVFSGQEDVELQKKATLGSNEDISRETENEVVERKSSIKTQSLERNGSPMFLKTKHLKTNKFSRSYSVNESSACRGKK